MNIKMRKNFALLMILAIAVFVASSGIVNAEKYNAETCTLNCGCVDFEIQYACELGYTCEDFCPSGSGTTSQGFAGNLEEISEDAPSSMKLVNEEEIVRYHDSYLVPAVSKVDLGDSGASFTCGESTFVVNQGSGSGGDDECTYNRDCPEGEECRVGTCVDPSGGDDEDDSGTASGSEDSETRESGGWFSGLFTANN